MNYNTLDKSKIYLITGAAGFIGCFLSQNLLEKGCIVIGVDNLNDYYDVNLKKHRLKLLTQYENFTFIKMDITDKANLEKIFETYEPNIVVNLAAQAGVRYSIINPDVYVQSNVIGFFNILECCRYSCEMGRTPVEHLVYASSSSVYGANTKVPFSVDDKTDDPVSLYAATKKCDELMARVYSHLYKIPATGLRFFTVYGPMGRPDMAYFSFAEKMVAGEPLQIFNNGEMKRDFTFIEDVIEIVETILSNPPEADSKSIKHKIYNIGNNHPERLLDYIEVLEKALSKAAGREMRTEKEFLPMQPGDVLQTYADTTVLENDFGMKPKTPIEEGLQKFADWYCSFYQVK